MPRSYIATPLASPALFKGEVRIIARTDFAALMRAKEVLGNETAFTVHEGKRLVVTYRPAERRIAEASSLGPS